MARKQKSGSSSSSRSSSRKPSAPTSTRRFLKAFSGAALAAFAVASAALNLDWPVGAARKELQGVALAWAPQDAGAAPESASVQGQDYAQTRFTACPQFFPGGSTPIVPARPNLRELCFDSFAILHDGRMKTPVFVVQRLNRRLLQQAADVPRSDRFYAEARLPANERAELADYKGSGYARGHMAPAADMPTPEAMAQSFSLANMVPQDQRHNSGAWNRIEQDTRKFVLRARGDVYIFTGPVFPEKPARIGAGRVAVPRYLFKAVHDAHSGRTWVYWQENGPDTEAGPPISYEEFVRRTGLHLLPQRAG